MYSQRTWQTKTRICWTVTEQRRAEKEVKAAGGGDSAKGARAEVVEKMQAMVEKLEGIEKRVDDFVKPPG